MTAIRALIDKGHVAEALQQLDVLAAQKPEAPGVERLRGVALYAQNNFAEADRAFTLELQQDNKDIESAQMRGLTLPGAAGLGMAAALLVSAIVLVADTE